MAATVAALALAATVAAPPSAHAHTTAASSEVTACSETTGSSTISSIDFTSNDGTYGIGDTIGIRVTASQATAADSGHIHVMGHTRVKLETGSTDRFAEYSSHTGGTGRIIDYTYTVQAGDVSSDLDYHSRTALFWTIRHGGLDWQPTDVHDAVYNCQLPATGGSGSLAHGNAVVVDGIAPEAQSVTSSTDDGTYGKGDTITVQVSFNDAVTVVTTGGTPTIQLETGATDRNATYSAADSTSTVLAFSYTVQPGDSSSDLDYANTVALSLNGGTIRDAAGNDATLTLKEPGISGSLGHSKNIIIDTPPAVSSVTSSSTDDSYKAGSTIVVQVEFDEAVTVVTTGGTPTIQLETGATDRNATYSAADSTSTVLAFSYTVQPGDSSSDLDYTGTTALSLNGGTIQNAQGDDADLTLKEPGDPGSLGDSKNIVIDTDDPSVSSVTSSSADDSYKAGSTIVVQVEFDEAVTVVTTGGTPTIQLETGATDRNVAYDASASTSTVLAFPYTVQPGDAASDLDYTGNTALSTNGGTIRDAAGNDADLDLEDPGTSGSLGDSKAIVVDTDDPAVSSVTSSSADDSYKAGSTIVVQVEFDEAVTVVTTGGTPTIQLETGATDRNVAYDASASTSTVLAFPYTVQPGDAASDLDYTGNTALSTNGGTIRDAAGNDADLDLEDPGTSGSLGDSKAIVVDTDDPAVSSVTSSSAGGPYLEGSTIVVQVEFDEPVTVDTTGGTPIIYLETGTIDRNATYSAAGSTPTVLAFSYTVERGDLSPDLDYNGTTALSANGGTIRDAAGNDADPELPPPGTDGLLDSGTILVDAVQPTVDSVSSTTQPDTYPIGSPIVVTVTFSEDVTVATTGGTPSIALNTGAAGRYAVYDAVASTARTLAFAYTVTEGDDTADLDYTAAAVIARNGGTIRDAAGNDADLGLDSPGTDGLLDSGTIRLEAVRPAVDSVSSTTQPGTYPIGSPIVVTVAFSEDVTVATTGGTPSIALNTGAAGRYAVYDAVASTARTLAFAYTVTEGDDTADLDYTAAAVIARNGGTIRDAAGNDADLGLDSPGTDGLLDSGTIRLEAIRPAVEYVTSETDNGPYPVDTVIDVRVKLGEAVIVDNSSGTPSIRLETGATDRNATFAGGNNSDTLVFTYTVQQGDESDDLNYTGTTSLSANGGTIRDAAGNDADLELPEWGDGDTLGERRDIAVDTAAPAVLSARAEFLDRIRVTFDEPVASGTVNASAGWSISGPSAANLSIAALGPVPTSAPRDNIVFMLNGTLPDTAPDLELSYDASAGGIRDEAGNLLQDGTGIVVADRIRPKIVEPLITGNREITIDYTEPVSASPGAYSGLEIGGDARQLDPHDTARLRQHVITFAGEPAPVPEPPSSMTVDGRIVLDGADPPNPLGDDVLTVEIRDGRVLDVFSSRITGPNTAVIAYTRNAEAPLEAYSSLVVGGQNRTITGLDGGDAGAGSHFHTLTFLPGGAPPSATGSVAIDGTAVVSPELDMRLGNGTVQRTLGDGQSPSVLGATAVSLDTIRVLFSEPVAAPGTGAGGWSVSGRDAEGLAVASIQDAAEPADSLDLVLGGDLPDTAPDAITLSYRPADGGSVEDAAGNGLVASSTSVADGIAPEARSAAVSGPNAAEVRYTEPVWAAPGAYASVTLSSGGEPRAVVWEGNGTDAHTVSFGGEPAGPDATGSLGVDAAAVRDAAGHALAAGGAIDLADGQSPSVLGATAVSLDTIRVLFSEPVAAQGTGAGGWSVSGRDADGLAVASSQDAAEPADSLNLVLDGDLPDAAPDGVVISYDPAGGNVADPAGNEPAASSADVADGIAPEVRSAFVAGPNAAEVRYTEPVWAAPGAYASVTLSSGGGLRVVSSLAGNGTAVHTVAFGGEPAGPGETGVLEMDATAVRDAARLPLGTDAAFLLDLAGAAPQPGNATARAVFTASNIVTITYSAALGPPAGHDGPVYAAVGIDGEGGGARPVTGVEGLGTAVHTVAFGGDGVGRNQTGAIVLAVDLEGTGAAATGIDPPRFAAGEIPVASGLTVQTVLVAQTRPPPVSIEPDGFTRAVDGTAAGAAARLAINVTALAGAPGAQGTATFPAEAVTLTASFGAVTFPPGVTATSVPAAGALYLYVDDGAASDEAATAALAHPNSGGMLLRTIVEAGGGDDNDGRIAFDMPVRISLDGQAGGRAFYIEGGADGAIMPIDLACAADDTERVHRQLGGSGECRIESGGDMVIHTYHLTRFGTAASERGTPPPVDHACSMRLGSESLAAPARPGGYSDAAEQAVVNSGSLPFSSVELEATPWSVTPLSGAPVQNATSSLPANSTLVSAARSDAGFEPLPAGGASVAHGLGGGLEVPLWFMLNLTGHAQVEGAELAQRVTYTAECAGAG